MSNIKAGNPISSIDWEELRDIFFEECVDKDTLPKVNLAPHDMFEWFKGKVINFDEALEDMKEDAINKIIRGVCADYGIESYMLGRKSKKRFLLVPRHAVACILHRKGLDPERIALAIRRDRSTVYNSIKVSKGLYATDAEFKLLVDKYV